MADTTTETEPETEQDNPSFAGVLKPHVADETQDQLLLIWGRFWSETENQAGGLYIQFNLDQNEIKVFRADLHTQKSDLDEYDPDQAPLEFKNTLPEQPRTNGNVPKADLQLLEQNVNQILAEKEKLRSLKTILEEKKRGQFSDWAYDFFSQIVKKGDMTYQVKGQLSLKEHLHASSPTSATENREDEQSDEEQNEDNRTYLPVSISTSPMKGDFPSDVSTGEEIFVRATGPVVDQLPDNMVDDRHEDVSTQLESTVVETESHPSLPPDFDGESQDYWRIAVEFLDGKFGEGFVHKDEQVKLVNPEDEDETSSSSLLSPFVLISTGTIILAIVGLAYFIFG